MDQPVIAAIHGDAVGRGLEMALACDIRFAAETSRFGLPHIKSGLIPRDGGTQRLVRLVGAGKAMEMILTGDPITAREAERIGLVNRVLPSEGIMDAVEAIAREMASGGPIALRYAKEAIGKGMDLTLDQGLRLEADLYFLLHTTADRNEGIRAFQEKRTPDFKGS
jgi:enoyl-CoA hydratase/carnithine racemase